MPCWGKGVKIVRNEGTIIFGNVDKMSLALNETETGGSGTEMTGEVETVNGRPAGDNSSGSGGSRGRGGKRRKRERNRRRGNRQKRRSRGHGGGCRCGKRRGCGRCCCGGSKRKCGCPYGKCGSSSACRPQWYRKVWEWLF